MLVVNHDPVNHVKNIVCAKRKEKKTRLTFAFPPHVLIDLGRLCAGNGVLAGLDCQRGAAHVQLAAVLAQGVHAALQGVVFPPEEVIRVLAVPGTLIT
jgi:hypothetical protein